MEDDLKKGIDILKKYHQYEILKQLEKNTNKKLIDQILKLDFKKINELYIQIREEKDSLKNNIDKIENINYIDQEKLLDYEKEKYENIGNDIIKQGKYAVVTMAGGQRNKTWT